MALTMIAAYDVCEDSRRASLAALLQIHGDRIQKSVFLLSLDEDEFTDLRKRAESIINTETDSLWFARQCAACWKEAVRLGQTDLAEPALYWSVW